jgi:hypothetical protein
MTSKATEKIIDALTQLVEGFAELQEGLEDDFKPGSDSDDEEGDSDEEGEGDIEDALVTEIRAAVEAVIENEDCAPEDLASIVSALTGALEEIDPEVFADDESSEDEDEEEEYEDDEDDEEYDEDEDDIDLDEEDDDYEEEDEDEEDEDDEDEDEEEDD